jgi:hypothetical protein
VRISQRRGGHKITRERYKVWTKLLNHLYRELDWMNGKDRVIVKVAKQRDGETVHSRGPAFQSNVFAHQSWPHGLDQHSIDAERNRACSPELNESSSADSNGGNAFMTCRSPK